MNPPRIPSSLSTSKTLSRLYALFCFLIFVLHLLLPLRRLDVCENVIEMGLIFASVMGIFCNHSRLSKTKTDLFSL